MKDLVICYINQNNYVCFNSYNTIMEFTDYIEQHPNASIMHAHSIKATFFEDPFHIKETNTMKELYDFCIEIMK